MKRRKDVSDMKKLQYLLMAVNDFDIKGYKPRTSLVGYACQYSSNPKLKPEDFEQVLNTKVSDILLGKLKEFGVNEPK